MRFLTVLAMALAIASVGALAAGNQKVRVGLATVPAEPAKRRLSMPLSHTTGGAGATYRLMYDLGVALNSGNWTYAESLVQDDALLFVSSISCDLISKSEFFAAAKKRPYAASWFEIGAWAGNGDSNAALFSGTLVAVGGAQSGARAGETFVEDGIWYAIANTSSNQLYMFQEFTASNHFPNASTMMDAVQRLTDASRIQDLDVWENAVSDDIDFTMAAAFNQFPDVHVNNKTAFISMLKKRWAEFPKVYIKVDKMMAFCDSVGLSLLWTGVRPDGTASINKFMLSFAFNSDMKVNYLSEFAMMPFMS